MSEWISVEDARKAMRREFEADHGTGSLYWSYVCNIAMFLHDKAGVEGLQTRNRLAHEMLVMLFDIDIPKPPEET